jgi:hypothetical protein
MGRESRVNLDRTPMRKGIIKSQPGFVCALLFNAFSKLRVQMAVIPLIWTALLGFQARAPAPDDSPPASAAGFGNLLSHVVAA